MKTEIVYALITGGIVENLIVCDDVFAAELSGQFDAVVLATGKPAHMGGEYVKSAFVPKIKSAV